MAAATTQCVSSQDRAALAAGLPSSPVHPGLSSVIAIGASEVAEIAEGGASGPNAELKDLHQGLAQLLKPLCTHGPRWSVGANACHEEAFIGIDVPHTCHQGLIE